MILRFSSRGFLQIRYWLFSAITIVNFSQPMKITCIIILTMKSFFFQYNGEKQKIADTRKKVLEINFSLLGDVFAISQSTENPA